MKARVLRNLAASAEARQAAAAPRRGRAPLVLLRRYAGLAAACLILIAGYLVFRGRSVVDPPLVQGTDLMGGYREEFFASAEELAVRAELPLREPGQLPFVPVRSEYALLSGEIAQLSYYGEQGESLVLRVSAGREDNSGDHRDYAQREVLQIAGLDVRLAGNEGVFALALWTDSQYAYSLSAEPGLGREAMLKLLKALLDAGAS